MGFWGRLFGAPSPAVVADTKALKRSRYEEPPRSADIIQPGSAMWRTYPADGITPERYRDLQRDADAGHVSHLMELYDDIASDYQVGSQLRTRKLAVAGAPLDFESGDGSETGARIADDAAKFWSNFPTRRQFALDVLDDFYRGFSCTRPIWDSVDGKWQIVAHQAIESRYFYFRDAVTPLICPVPGSADGVPVPDGYVYSEFRDKAGPVVRGSVGRSVGKFFVYKGYFLVDMASYLERYASPHVQVNTDHELREGSNELERVKDAARSFVADQIGIMPAGSTLAVIEAVNKAATVRDVYIVAIDFCDLACSKAISGQTLTADAGPGGIGNGGAAEEHGDVRQDLKEADASRLEQVLRAHVITPWTRYHHGPLAPVPQICINVAKPEDKVKATLAQKQRAETINILRSAGLKIKAVPTYEEFELEKPDDVADEDVLEPPAPPPQATDTGDPSGGVPAPGTKKPPAPEK